MASLLSAAPKTKKISLSNIVRTFKKLAHSSGLTNLFLTTLMPDLLSAVLKTLKKYMFDRDRSEFKKSTGRIGSASLF